MKQHFISITAPSIILLLMSCGNHSAAVKNNALPNDISANTDNKTPNEGGTMPPISAKMPDKAGKSTLQFPAPDGLPIYADLYHKDRGLPVVLLCHQAGSSKGEYATIAPRLNKLGFNCMAIDQRSGGSAFMGENLTAKEAESRKLPTKYIDAEQDITAAIEYAFAMLLGSSYSASLALKVGGQNPKVWAVASFSPGEYFSDKQLIGQAAQKLNKPTFISSSKEEAAATKMIFDKVRSSEKAQFIPVGKGEHGASALLDSNPNAAEYWKALEGFLNKVK